MGIIKLGSQHFDQSTLITHPSRSYSSASAEGIHRWMQGVIPGITGAIFPFTERSTSIKDTQFLVEDSSGFIGSTDGKNKQSLDETLRNLRIQGGTVEIGKDGKVSSEELTAAQQLIDFVGILPQSTRSIQQKHITRRVQGAPVNDDEAPLRTNAAFNLVEKTLFPYYLSTFPGMGMDYRNYHSLNFFTASNARNDTALIFPAATMSIPPGVMEDPAADHLWVRAFNAPYRPFAEFTFCFYINPRYNDAYDYVDGKREEFRAGTIMHMSSCYAVSLVSGSSIGQDGRPDQFRIMLQLSHSADVPPSKVDLTAGHDTGKDGSGQPRKYPEDLIFITSDSGSLKYNNWHHVAITWGGPDINHYTGSIYVDSKVDTTFVLHNSQSAFTRFFPPVDPTHALPQGTGPKLTGRGDGLFSARDPDALIVGNYYEGKNRISDKSAISLFFNKEVSAWEGITRSGESADLASSLQPSLPDSSKFDLRHPLNAEIHDLRIYKTALDGKQIQAASQTGPRFVVTQSSFREFLNSTPAPGVGGKFVIKEVKADDSIENVGIGGGKCNNPDLMFYLPPFFVKESRSRHFHKTPYQRTLTSGSTINPINAVMSFATNIHDINLENFTREFVRAQYPRLYHLTASALGDEHHHRGGGYSNNNFATAAWYVYKSLVCDGKGLQLEGGYTDKNSGYAYTQTMVTAYGKSEDDRKSVNKRQLTIMPNDNGLFYPNFSLLLTGTTAGPQLTPASKYEKRFPAGSKLDPPIPENAATVYDRNFSVEILSGSELDKSVNNSSTYFKNQPIQYYHLSLGVAATAKLVVSSDTTTGGPIDPTEVNGKRLVLWDASGTGHTLTFDTSILSENSTGTTIGYGFETGGDVTNTDFLRVGIINAINRAPAASLNMVAQIGVGGGDIILTMLGKSALGNGSKIGLKNADGSFLTKAPSTMVAMFSDIPNFTGGFGSTGTGVVLKPVPRPAGVLDLSMINMSDLLFIHPKDMTTAQLEQDKTSFAGTISSIYRNTPNPWNPAQMNGIPNVDVDTQASDPNYPQRYSFHRDSTPYMYTFLGNSPSSNAKVLFDIPQLFYGDRIDPGSFKMWGGIGSTKLTTAGAFKDTLKVTLKDNGEGVLYRGDARTPHAKWNKVGNVLYNEGLTLITSPHLKDFGEFHYQVDLQGTHNVHVLEIMVPCPAGRINSSSNPEYRPLLPSDRATDKNSEFVYITGLNFHDDNFNVIARTNLAQPVIKRSDDKLMFRIKVDY